MVPGGLGQHDVEVDIGRPFGVRDRDVVDVVTGPRQRRSNPSEDLTRIGIELVEEVRGRHAEPQFLLRWFAAFIHPR